VWISKKHLAEVDYDGGAIKIFKYRNLDIFEEAMEVNRRYYGDREDMHIAKKMEFIDRIYYYRHKIDRFCPVGSIKVLRIEPKEQSERKEYLRFYVLDNNNRYEMAFLDKEEAVEYIHNQAEGEKIYSLTEDEMYFEDLPDGKECYFHFPEGGDPFLVGSIREIVI
jgi:hypothetical protein